MTMTRVERFVGLGRTMNELLSALLLQNELQRLAYGML